MKKNIELLYFRLVFNISILQINLLRMQIRQICVRSLEVIQPDSSEVRICSYYRGTKLVERRER